MTPKDSKSNREHSFDKYLAEIHGPEKAILLKNFEYWCKENERKRSKHYLKDGFYYTAESLRSLSEKYPYMKKASLSRWVNELAETRWLVILRFNAEVNFYRPGSQFDRWNAGEELEDLSQNEKPRCTKMEHDPSQNETPPCTKMGHTNIEIDVEGNVEGNISQDGKKPPEPPKKIPWTKSVSTLFDRVLVEVQTSTPEEEKMTFNWAAGAEQHFASLKRLKKAMEVDMLKKSGKNELTEDDFQKGFDFLFRFGFDYMKGIAEAKGGSIKFSPAIILRNYNQILQHARQSHKPATKVADTKSARERDAFHDLVSSAGEIDFGENRGV